MRWARTGNGSEDARLCMSWTEKGGPEVRLPSHKGFGQVVTEQLTARALQGKANLMFDRGGRLLDARHPGESISSRSRHPVLADTR